jgi:hypothetical protein
MERICFQMLTSLAALWLATSVIGGLMLLNAYPEHPNDRLRAQIEHASNVEDAIQTIGVGTTVAVGLFGFGVLVRNSKKH